MAEAITLPEITVTPEDTALPRPEGQAVATPPPAPGQEASGFQLTPEQAAMLTAEAEAGNQQDRARAAENLPTRVARDIWGGIREAPGQIARGATEALDAAAQGLRSLAGATGLASEEFLDRNPADPMADRVAPEALTVTGGLVNDVSQFVAGLIPAGRLLRMGGVAVGANASAGARVAAAGAQGAIADFTAFDPHQERLANLIEQYPSLSNPVTQFLASDPNDSEAMGRLKNALEGLGIGVALDVVLQGFRLMRSARRQNAPDANAAAEELERLNPQAAPRDPVEVLREDRPEVQSAAPNEGRINDPAQPEMDLGGGSAPRPDSPAAAVRENPTASPTPLATPNAPRLIEVDEAGLRDAVRQNITEQGFGQGRNISGIRTDLIQGGEDIASMMSALRTVYREEMDRAIGGTTRGTDDPVRSLADTRRNAERLADVLGDDPSLFWQRMTSIHGTTRNLDAELLVYRDTLATVHDRTRRLAEAVNDPLGTATAGFSSRLELMNQFRRHVELAANIQTAYRGIQTNVARALNAMRLPAQIDPALLRHGADAFFDGGEDAVRRMAARVLATGDDLTAFNAATRGGWLRNSIGVVNEYWINAILSGPKTHAVNVLSNVLTTALQPAERMIAGALHMATPAGRRQFAEGALQYAGMAMSLRDAVQMAGRALRVGDAVLDPGRLAVEQRQAITTTRLGSPTSASAIDPISAAAVDGLGAMIRLPTRFLATEDEFFKQLTYRARIRAEGLREGIAAHGLDVRRVAQHAEEAVRGRVDPVTGAALDERHLRAAREVTFTQDLAAQTWVSEQTLGESLRHMVHHHPGLTMILPFIRTPTNILRFMWDRTPGLNMLRAQYANDFRGRNGQEAAQLARARMLTGATLWGAAVTYAYEGTITGSGPADPAARRELMQTGWRPFSVRVTQEDGSVEYRAYDRMDPFGMFFGIAATMAEVAGYADEREYDQLALDATVALARNLQSKTYLAGLTRAVAALAEPERRGERFLQGLVGSFVPSGLQQSLSDDPHMRDVRNIADALRARTPGLSMDVDPQRNVLGEVISVPVGWGPDWISPIATSVHPGGQQPNTPEWRVTPQTGVHDEIARQLLIHGASLRPPSPEHGTVDLREFTSAETGRTAYDRYMELTGTVQRNGKTLRQTLQDLIRSPVYRDRLTDGTFDHDGSRIDVIRSVIGEYRAVALAQLRREIPALNTALRQEDFRRAGMRINR